MTMANAKGTGDASTSNSNPHTDDAANLTQTGTTASSPVEMHVSGTEDKEENAIEEMNKLENAMEESKNEENAKEEEEGEEEEEEEEDAMEEEKNADEEVIEGGEENSSEKGEENEKDAIEGAENAAKGKKNEEKEKAEKKTTKLRRSRDKKNARAQSEKATGKGKGKDKDKPESSRKKKPSKKAESMGMIFMCSSKTKKDCYRYKVLGLPANKRDMVEKVYRGMRLFLFDVDLRLMYGIYKAAGPGGYNIEPKAFKSEFPAQVRFTVLDDCSPLTEEKFKKVIKDNYYTRNKFDCMLNSEQVKNLCKLFIAANKGSKSRKVGRSRREETHSFAGRDRIRKHALDEERRSARVGEHRYHERPVIYERETFASPVAALSRVPPLPAAAPAPSYVYGRTLDTYGLQHRDHRFIDLEPRRGDDIEHRDPYILYRDPPIYRDQVYSAGLPPEYNRSAVPTSEHRPLAGLPPEYSRTSAVASEYLTVAGPTSEYRSIAVQPSYYRVAATPQPTSEYRTVAVPQPEYDPHRSLYRY